MIAGFKDEQATMLEPNQIYRVYASEGKVYAEAENGTHLLRLRLYEVEQRLAKCSFVRISNGEIINLKKVKDLWKYIKDKDPRTYHHLRWGALGHAMNLPGRFGRYLSVKAYKISQRFMGFN